MNQPPLGGAINTSVRVVHAALATLCGWPGSLEISLGEKGVLFSPTSVRRLYSVA